MDERRSLILVHSPGWQDRADFEDIAARIEKMAPDIDVFIADNTSVCSVTRKRAARQPTLVFSPIRLLTFRALRGKVYQGQVMTKLTEMERLQKAGLPVPAFEVIRPGCSLSPEQFGPYTIIKPSYELSSWGDGISLERTEDVRYRDPAEFPDGHPGRMGPMIAQRYIDCGQPMTCRVLTLFGEPIFTYLREAVNAPVLDQLSPPYQRTAFLPIDQELKISSTRDEDFLELARNAYQAIPEAALQACDILRDRNGELYLLEVNPGGGTWMFSSPYASAYRQALGTDDLTAEFDAFSVCARVLIEKTRQEAI